MQKYKKKKIFNLVTISAAPWFSNIWTSNLHHVVHLLYVNTFFKKKQILNYAVVNIFCHSYIMIASHKLNKAYLAIADFFTNQSNFVLFQDI